MLDYQEIKNWFVDKDNQKKMVVGVGFVVVFLVGFGSGHYEKASARSKLPANYSSSQTKKPATPAVSKEADAIQPATTGQGTAKNLPTTPVVPVDPANCPVKGNISSGNKKIYHVPGGAFYKTVKPEQCFATEAEAQAAGFVKSRR